MMTAEQYGTQRSEGEIRALYDLIMRDAVLDCVGPVSSRDREGHEYQRLFAIADVLAWAVGDAGMPADSQVARDTFVWLSGAGPCPVDERGHTPGFVARSRKTA